MTTRERKNVQKALSVVYSLYLEAQANEEIHEGWYTIHGMYWSVRNLAESLIGVEEVKSILRKIYEVEQPF